MSENECQLLWQMKKMDSLSYIWKELIVRSFEDFQKIRINKKSRTFNSTFSEQVKLDLEYFYLHTR